jgi:hypothetical protein
MGGALRLADRDAPGACFLLTLPAAEPEIHPVERAALAKSRT